MLGNQPPVFPMPVKFKRLDGSEFTITFDVKGMRKTQWAEIKDGFFKATAEQGEAAKESAQKSSLVEIVGKSLHDGGEMILKFATGWDLSDPFNAATLADLEDRFGGSLGRIVEAYDAAAFHGRLGNSD